MRQLLLPLSEVENKDKPDLEKERKLDDKKWRKIIKELDKNEDCIVALEEFTEAVETLI